MPLWPVRVRPVGVPSSPDEKPLISMKLSDTVRPFQLTLFYRVLPSIDRYPTEYAAIFGPASAAKIA